MNRRMRHIKVYSKSLPLIAVLTFMSCTASMDVDTSSTGIPLQVTAGMETADTRSTTATTNTWTVNDVVTIKDGSNSTAYQYKISDATTGAMTAASTNIYFGPSETSKSITAWSYGGGTYTATLPTSWSVSTDQSTADNLQANDFLYAPAVTAYPMKAAALTFGHKTSQILIRVTSTNSTITSASNLQSVTVKAVNSGTFDGSAWTISGTTLASITPFSGTLSGYIATYTALIIPQTMSGKELFRFVFSNSGITYTYAYTPTTAVFEAGKQYIFDVSFALDKVAISSVTVASWTATTAGNLSSQPNYIQPGIGNWTTTTDGAITVN